MLVKYDIPEVEIRAPFKHARAGDAGFDLCNASSKYVNVPPGQVTRVVSGVSVKIPNGYVGFIRARSSTFAKHGLFIIEGVIDSGYVGPLYTMVWCPGIIGPDGERVKNGTIEPWQRVSQLIVVAYAQGDPIVVTSLPTTERGARGFGSTGI